MPHLTIEYSANLGADSDLAALCARQHAALLASGLVEPGAIRVRALPCPFYAVGDLLAENGFADMVLRMGAGRTAAQLTALGESLMAVAADHFAPQLARPHFALSLEVQEISAHSWKRNAIHPRLRAANA
ncbi:5-carboxymethyl-2-hydroxymuconate Delta-isomerase [Rhodobacter ferrooxidans]|uniref:5-carboxymethyl-2-hydroxymuconate isomerase n=1 Tax=Rhodobacter ferrooxidans TaxID=371731 RepID=C8RX99_9RHOB|nr:5-carboxymethyl-2-hydroxymuconate Delta-isomerase [Rhodobacter sp. SW2]EEW26624.1 5-carboxymethyl-2-hydroxymuconate isomerase [Rhodobacter sp. SW2]